MSKEKRDSKPLLVKFGVAVALSFAGFLYSRFRTLNRVSDADIIDYADGHGEIDSGEDNRSKDDFRAIKMSQTLDHEEMSKQRTNDSRSISHDGDAFFLANFNDLVEEFDCTGVIGPSPKQEVETPGSDLDVEKDDYELEIEHLRNMVGMLRERESYLEVQLLEYYGLKEQETAVSELRNRLKINNMEAKLLSLKVESLQSEKQRLEDQVVDHAIVVAELERARSRIKVLEKKFRHEAEKNKEQILNLQKRVARLQEQELEAPANNPDIESKLQRLKVLECEVEELRKSNTRLQLENSELSRKLESTQILANSVLDDPERKAIDETSNCLRHENEDLTKQIEQLQSDRCTDVEELVYLRWINACLRYELRNYRSLTSETGKSRSPKSEAKAQKLVLEYAHDEGMGHKGMDSMDFDYDQWSFSQASETRELDDSWIEDSSATKPTSSGKNKFFKNLRRLIQRKDRNHPNKASSKSKTDHPCVYDPPTWSSSTTNDSVTMLRSRSERAATPSQGSSGTSSDVPRWSSLNDECIKDVEKFRNDCTSYGYKRFILGNDNNDDDSNFPLESELVNDSNSLQKSELVKFAEVSKGDGSRTVKIHKKSASII